MGCIGQYYWEKCILFTILLSSLNGLSQKWLTETKYIRPIWFFPAQKSPLYSVQSQVDSYQVGTNSETKAESKPYFNLSNKARRMERIVS